jgi:glutamine amidotransferase
MSKTVGIVDSSLGNIGAIRSILLKIGSNGTICSNPQKISNFDSIILPGVGAFDHGVSNLKEKGWIDILNEEVLVRKKPVLGICLGMQLMCKSSEEGVLPGLGWIDAVVKKFSLEESTLKVPHMGWNSIEVCKPNPLIDLSEEEIRFYFTHSYHPVCSDPSDILATTHHGYNVTAAFNHNNIFGVQFHPEKSHRFGMELLKKFVKL